MGWNPYVPKIDDSTINVSEYYKKICEEFEEKPIQNLTTDQELELISEKLGYTVTRDHFIFDPRLEPQPEQETEEEVMDDEIYFEIDDDTTKKKETKNKVWRPNISMKTFYNFILQERSGGVKTMHKGPHHDLYEYKHRENKKKKKSDRDDLPPLDSMWKGEVNWKGFQWKVRPHDVSRVLTLERKNEKGKIIRIPFPKELRLPEKKNPILYGGRLKLFYLCDQGVKIENNNLRFHEQDDQQKKYCTTNFKLAMDHAETKTPVENVGKRRILPSSFTFGKRCYSQRYYDAMAVVLARQRPDLFITVTGTIQSHELERLRDGRSKNELICIANRVFAIKLKRFMHDIVKKQIFGRIVGEIWIIEYQKRGIPHAHICLCLDRNDKLRKGTDFQRTNDLVDQMIWAEIPVDDGDVNGPAGWRFADIDRKDRWCYNEVIEPDENTRADEEDEQEKIEDLMENLDLHKKKKSSFEIIARSTDVDNGMDEELESEEIYAEQEETWMSQGVWESEEEPLPSDNEISPRKNGIREGSLSLPSINLGISEPNDVQEKLSNRARPRDDDDPFYAEEKMCEVQSNSTSLTLRIIVLIGKSFYIGL